MQRKHIHPPDSHSGLRGILRRPPAWAAWFVLCAAGPVSANTLWVDAAPTQPEIGRPVEIRIGRGHLFPESRGAMRRAERLQVAVHRPDGVKERIEVARAGPHLTGRFIPAETGPHLVAVELSGVRDAPATASARSIVDAGGHGGRAADYRVKHGLEIAPMEPVSGLEAGARGSFMVLRDGRPVEADIRVLPPDRRAFSVPSRAGPTWIPLLQPGAYLLTVFHEGHETTLTLRITGPPPPGE